MLKRRRVTADVRFSCGESSSRIKWGVMEARKHTLAVKIDRIKKELTELGELRPGSLSEQYNVCGKAGCRCKADPPEKHGPYYQISFSRHGKSRSQFVRKEDLTRAKRQLKNYERLRTLVDQWIELSLELVSLELGKKP